VTGLKWWRKQGVEWTVAHCLSSLRVGGQCGWLCSYQLFSGLSTSVYEIVHLVIGGRPLAEW